MTLGGIEELAAITDGADDVELMIAQEANQAFSHDRVIVGNDNSGQAHLSMDPGSRGF